MRLWHACAFGLALGLLGSTAAEAQTLTTQPDGYYFRFEGG